MSLVDRIQKAHLIVEIHAAERKFDLETANKLRYQLARIEMNAFRVEQGLSI